MSAAGITRVPKTVPVTGPGAVSCTPRAGAPHESVYSRHRHAPSILLFAVATLAAAAGHAEDYGFDVSEFEKKSFELGGYAEAKAEYLALEEDSAGYAINFFDDDPGEDTDRYTATLELNGTYRRDPVRFDFLAHAEGVDDFRDTEAEARLYEGLLTWRPATGLAAELGKKAVKWGKGYAWNPVAFLERPKDPNDPDLSREGFVIAGADLIKSFAGPLKTVAFTPLVLPVSSSLNDDFGQPNHRNPAAKLYLLYRDTDIDFLYLDEGSRSRRFGFDFARNLATNLEIHGEWARIVDFQRKRLGPGDTLVTEEEDVTSYLLGLRYLSARETTYILEYYHNGTGYRRRELERFYDRVLTAAATGDTALLATLAAAAEETYLRPNPGRRYLYLRISQKEPFGLVYSSAAATVIKNLDDESYSVTPELLYTGFNDLELRLRLAHNSGDALSEYGEKPTRYKWEVRLRYYF